MAELLLELFCEEIPARMQQRATEDLQRLVCSGLKDAGLEIGSAQSYATPRRLVLVVDDVPAVSPAVSQERKGPRVGAPDKAIAGFLRGAELETIEQAEVVSDAKKDDFYVARLEKPGRAAADIVAEVVSDVVQKFPWPKSMRWGSAEFNWVRPLHGVLCLLGGKVVAMTLGGVEAGNVTRGHRFHGANAIEVKNFEDYGTQLKANKVILPASERAAAIGEQAHELAEAAGLELVEDDGLILENAGLTEWPTVLIGSFEDAFLEVPPECLISSMRAHQKCFSLRDPKTGKLANQFLTVTNLIAADGGVEIVAGNEKVIRARLSDAKFFWEQDLKRPLDEMANGLEKVTFHEKLGTQKERVERIAELAAQLAPSVDASAQDARRAAQLCKADLTSEMVGEFPELQGLMGRYYAEKAGTKASIAQAIEEHYKPKGQGDDVPTATVSVAVALADKLDTLVGFWAIDEKPTGSGDPYQLRRAALGVVRILLENDLRLRLNSILQTQFKFLASHRVAARRAELLNRIEALKTTKKRGLLQITAERDREELDEIDQSVARELAAADLNADNLLSFFADRLKVHLREEGVRHDLIDAVFALDGQDDIALIVKRVEALADFLETEDGGNLLAGAKRAANILGIEEKKDSVVFTGAPDGNLLKEAEERGLEAAIAKVRFDTQAAINVENFEGAMRALAELRQPVDQFFEHVKVNDDDAAIRANRLKLLAEIRAATLAVADFSKISG